MTAPGPVQAFLDAQPREQLDFLTVAEKRQYMRHLSDLNYLRYGRRPEPEPTVTDHLVATPAGPVRVKAYRPAGVTGVLPAHLFLHGGGWWLGSVDELVNDAICRLRCLRANTSSSIDTDCSKILTRAAPPPTHRPDADRPRGATPC